MWLSCFEVSIFEFLIIVAALGEFIFEVSWLFQVGIIGWTSGPFVLLIEIALKLEGGLADHFNEYINYY